LDDGRRKSRVASHISHIEDVDEIVQHDISTTNFTSVSINSKRWVNLQQLLPDLNTDTNNGALPDARRKQSEVANVLGLIGDSNSFTNFFHLSEDNRAVKVTAGMKVSKIKVSLFPAVVLSKPSWGLWEEEERGKKNESRNSLDAPSDSERSRSINTDGAAIGDEIHDEDT
jgi:hypothetical protein